MTAFFVYYALLALSFVGLLVVALVLMDRRGPDRAYECSLKETEGRRGGNPGSTRVNAWDK